MTEPLVEMRGITKFFPGVRALHKVDFSVGRGEILGLIGENGAGKSTLMKILTGVYQPDEGEIYLEGRRFHLRDTRDAYRNGISIIFQELNNCLNLTAVENLFLGKELRIRGTPFLDLQGMREKARELFGRLNLDVDPDTPMRHLSTARQQLVEIARALSWDVKLLIMDEPTSSLSDREIANLMAIMRDLKGHGISMVFISHKIEEVLSVADRIVVLRDGEKVAEEPAREATQERVIAAMVGRELGRMFTARRKAPSKEPVLEVHRLSGPPNIRDVSFVLHRGEILGVAGLMGAGRTEMARLLIGAAPRTEGSVRIDGRQALIDSPERAVRAGLAYLPEDRKTEGLVLPMTVRENMTLSIHERLCRLLNFIRRSEERQICRRFIEDLAIKTPNEEAVVDTLSGGNQQKVVLAKGLAAEPRVLILDEPTRGIDVGAKAEVHRIIAELADAGAAILLISSELPEILALSDRVMVMHDGTIKGILDRSEASQQSIMTLALS